MAVNDFNGIWDCSDGRKDGELGLSLGERVRDRFHRSVCEPHRRSVHGAEPGMDYTRSANKLNSMIGAVFQAFLAREPHQMAVYVK